MLLATESRNARPGFCFWDACFVGRLWHGGGAVVLTWGMASLGLSVVGSKASVQAVSLGASGRDGKEPTLMELLGFPKA